MKRAACAHVLLILRQVVLLMLLMLLLASLVAVLLVAGLVVLLILEVLLLLLLLMLLLLLSFHGLIMGLVFSHQLTVVCVHSWADRKAWGGGCRETGGSGTVEGSHVCR